jgi:oligoribonuclease (3'-5' exoribonuclease)
MKYLSIDIEATGLDEDCLIIEFGMIPFDAKTRTLADDLAMGFYVQCPTYESLEANLNPWVKEHNKELIQKANTEGVSQEEFKRKLQEYLDSAAVKEYFGKDKIVLFGKSLSAIDLPFLNRDLGWEWMGEHFSHRNLDLSCLVYGLVDMGKLPKECVAGGFLMKHLGYGEVEHTALEDAVNTAKMYLKILELTE